MVNLTIDGCAVSVPEGTTILEAARTVNINIPTLCHHDDLDVKAACRICVVEVNGGAVLQPACETLVAEGLDVKTATPRVIKYRRNILELIFARHPQDCLTCRKNDLCELRKVAERLGVHHATFYGYDPRPDRLDTSSPSIVRNPAKCILCGRCVEVCSNVQSVHVLAKENRGYYTNIVPPYGRALADTACVNCGQCYQVCPTGAITIRDDTWRIYEAYAEGKDLVVQIAPSVRVNLAECLGEAPGTVSTGRIVTALKRLGFTKVLDADFAADLTLMEEGTELRNRLQNGGVMPMITSCSPGWIRYCEQHYPEMVPNLSTCKSPQQMFGSLVKSYYAHKAGLDPRDIVVVSIMPCTAKKYEVQREEQRMATGCMPVDVSLT
ncbi:MAG: 2Fe-2S iron-sulfur cluster-binding protein, partial [Oscillospiraceae bacterium]|nr:2Fe-2S iron-sulfur cluster-binding protein [Oscillospiraceae bacterium]